MNDFCVLILTHGRPDKVHTLKTLKRYGYTGDWYIVLDDEDPTIEQYKKNFENVVVFSKEDIARRFDEGDNFNDRRSIFYARNASFEIAKNLGYRYFLQLDDDYDTFRWRMSPEIEYSSKMLSTDERCLDRVFEVMLDFLKETPISTVCMAQSGDFIGGAGSKMCVDQYRRKAMNSFFCDTKRPFEFQGKINEDVNAYTSLASKGKVMLTTAYVSLNQKTTQSNSGGMSELYLDGGTYIKTFYSVMIHPSGVKVSILFNTSARKAKGPKTNEAFRIHHRISWNNVAPKIIREETKKYLTT